MVQEVHQPKGRQEVCNLLVTVFFKRLMYTFMSPRKTGSLAGKSSSASFRYGRLSRVDSGRYAQMINVFLLPATISHLTTFGPWKRVDLTVHFSDNPHDIITTPPFDTLALVTVALEHTMPYPRWLLQYTTSRIFVYVKSMRS